MQNKTFAVVGATGMVGTTLLSILEERGVSPSSVFPLASKESSGRPVSFGMDHTLEIGPLETFDFSKVDVAFFCVSSGISERTVPKALEEGVWVIDKSSHFRLQPGVPLVVPEVNGHALKSPPKKGIVASPNCIAIPLACALKPMNDLYPIQRISVATYQSVSGAGKEAMDELYNHTKGFYTQEMPLPKAFAKPISFNVLPMIDTLCASGYTAEEEKIHFELKKILGPTLAVNVTSVRVPVFIGHAMAVSATFSEKIHVEKIASSLKKEPGIHFESNRHSFQAPLDVVGHDQVFVSRLRRDLDCPRSLSFWVSCDNLRKGAALNAVQIAELLCAHHENRFQAPPTRKTRP